ncbi:MAG: type III pantothenate kinase, partial [Firmicutes bacterium]|nr:type III pantothenate kinase [Bacillota bacterium]
VVPPVSGAWVRMCRQYFGREPMVVGPGIRTGLSIKMENPREVGADRIVNAVAAMEKYGGPVIVIDFSTATTFDVISGRGEYLGGVIAPGLSISVEALVQRTAQLPRIEMVKPRRVIGKNTVSSMQSGVMYGAVGQVNEIVRRLKEELGGDAYVVATGGLAEMISKETREINEVNPLLTLEGLRILYERNQQSS